MSPEVCKTPSIEMWLMLTLSTTKMTQKCTSHKVKALGKLALSCDCFFPYLTPLVPKDSLLVRGHLTFGVWLFWLEPPSDGARASEVFDRYASYSSRSHPVVKGCRSVECIWLAPRTFKPQILLANVPSVIRRDCNSRKTRH